MVRERDGKGDNNTMGVAAACVIAQEAGSQAKKRPAGARAKNPNEMGQELSVAGHVVRLAGARHSHERGVVCHGGTPVCSQAYRLPVQQMTQV